ncbi:MAG TPA: DNA methylase [Anaerolineae bacterium]|nr:DNA methylase [Anaerolineae bacterium]HCC79156.1 DNA methylase [Anaerolineae bacterium]HCM97489.1 DNA methylase [Anaerolineae bacterium]
MTFENDEVRRKYFIELLREKLQDPEFRNIEGFPIGEDEDILRLSDPPYYTACPNPFLEEVMATWQKERQITRSDLGLQEEANQREPYAADISEGKNDPIYNAHSYHTKVPHKAIMRYILHYTDPGDIVFDGFCGTGMAGVAAQLCSDKKSVEELGYRVDEKGVVWDGNKIIAHIGARKAVLNDLSPAATFISYNYNTPVDPVAFVVEFQRILMEMEQECGWMYETWHPHCDALNRKKGKINYTVWSDVYLCPNCGKEMVYWEIAVDHECGAMREEWSCPSCATLLAKNPRKDSGSLRVERVWETRFDRELKQTIRQAKQIPVLINYRVGKKRFEKRLDATDLDLIIKIEESEIPNPIPTQLMMFKGTEWGDTWRAGVHAGISHVHHFYTRRNLWVLGEYFRKLNNFSYRLNMVLDFLHGSVLPKITKMNRYMPQHGSRALVGPMANTYYLPSMWVENNVLDQYEFQFKKIIQAIPNHSSSTISTCAAQAISISNSVDYIFTDPPFGANIMYSELNSIREYWLKCITNQSPEAIESKSQGKSLSKYQTLMTLCFMKFYDALKPGRWITVEFHNSKYSVWNAIQEALQFVGFIIADVRILDKTRGGLQSMIGPTATKEDLVISAYKPNGNLEERTRLTAGTEESAWEFVRYHLGKLPIINQVENNLMVNLERQGFLLFDRMVAFHVQRNFLVPMSTTEFFAGLEQRFPERDGMYFLPDQVGEYDQARLQVQQVHQLQLFVTDESSAILWLRQQLEAHPQTYQDLFPKFIRETNAWEKHEKTLELSEILEQNFLSFDGTGLIPEQIWTWMMRDDEMRNMVKSQSREIASNHIHTLVKGRWYVPDLNNAQQLEKLRERTLLKDFEGYKNFPGKKLKVFRIEAVRAGFKKAWQDRDYKLIIAVAEKISEDALQEDPKLLMWYDQALTRSKL